MLNIIFLVRFTLSQTKTRKKMRAYRIYIYNLRTLHSLICMSQVVMKYKPLLARVEHIASWDSVYKHTSGLKGFQLSDVKHSTLILLISSKTSLLL